MPISPDGAREPCTRCGGRLYYHDQDQDLCASCARALGIARICDRPCGYTVTKVVRIKAGDERNPVTIYLEET